LLCVRSATVSCKRRFSSFSFFNRFAADDFMPPYWLRQQWNVCSLTQSF